MPSLGTVYDFKLNEDVVVSVVIDEISSIICQKEQCHISGDRNEFLLFSEDKRRLLSLGLSLYENDIKTGDRLVLV